MFLIKYMNNFLWAIWFTKSENDKNNKLELLIILIQKHVSISNVIKSAKTVNKNELYKLLQSDEHTLGERGNAQSTWGKNDHITSIARAPG